MNTKEEKKVTLEEVKVQSFITALDNDEQKVVKGGEEFELGTTSIRIFC